MGEEVPERGLPDGRSSLARILRRGFYISIWVAMRNVGSIIGGAITLGLNIKKSGGGSVSTNTYLVFLGLECIGMSY